MTATPARLAALQVLRAVQRGEFADRALERDLEPLPERERAWTRELTLGVLRFRGRLDHILTAFTHRPLDTLDTDVLEALRLGTYQLLSMDGVPPYAAVSQTVDLVKATHPGAAGLVNAVLQSVRRAGGKTEWPSLESDPVAHLTTWGSHPAWLVGRWLRRFGPRAASQLIDANNSRPPLYLRPAGLSVADALARWKAAGIAITAVERVPELVRLENASDIMAALDAVPAVAQDPAAALVVRFVDPAPASVVADLCAAPGGKAIALASGTGPASPRRVFVGDISAGRLDRLRANLQRTAPAAVSVHVADARAPAIRPVDIVLVDVPCTGTGTLRRHVDGRWRVGPEDIMALSALQTQILDGAASAVRPGGLLVYATCSLEPEENEDRIGDFLDRHGEFVLEPPDDFDSDFLDSGFLRVLPHEHGFDGAFAARMRRRA